MSNKPLIILFIFVMGSITFLAFSPSDAAIPPTKAFSNVSDDVTNIEALNFRDTLYLTAGENMTLQYFPSNNTVRFVSLGGDMPELPSNVAFTDSTNDFTSSQVIDRTGVAGLFLKRDNTGTNQEKGRLRVQYVDSNSDVQHLNDYSVRLRSEAALGDFEGELRIRLADNGVLTDYVSYNRASDPQQITYHKAVNYNDRINIPTDVRLYFDGNTGDTFMRKETGQGLVLSENNIDLLTVNDQNIITSGVPFIINDTDSETDLRLFRSQTGNNDIGELGFYGLDSGSAVQRYSYMQSSVVDDTAGSEDSEFFFISIVGGVDEIVLQSDLDGGKSSTPSINLSDDFDLILWPDEHLCLDGVGQCETTIRESTDGHIMFQTDLEDAYEMSDTHLDLNTNKLAGSMTCSNGELLQYDSVGDEWDCYAKPVVKSGTSSIPDNSATTVSFNTAFPSAPNCVVSFAEDPGNTQALHVLNVGTGSFDIYQDAQGSSNKDISWICTTYPNP